MAPHRRITVDFDPGILDEVDRAARAIDTSRNRFIARAVERALRAEERNRIDTAFSRMSEDPAYRKILASVESEMAGASDDAWRTIDAAERVRGKRRAAR